MVLFLLSVQRKQIVIVGIVVVGDGSYHQGRQRQSGEDVLDGGKQHGGRWWQILFLYCRATAQCKKRESQNKQL
jgi:hypothetical protein